ncbi:fibroblast growth factor receptor 2-like [Acropora millepora]|uniref:fibroblast growth factor receptor 2-like n=1 Tax=Acropora millepora TaxID=45264 RepID=UPI001CF2DFDF|nr:fibroblast growth factor receptor 2-like [Acropora millepora]
MVAAHRKKISPLTISLIYGIIQLANGGSITWFEPPPTQTASGPLTVSETNKTLIKGSPNEEVSCNFSLTADLSIIAVSMKFGGKAAATLVKNQQAPSVEPIFASRLNATWYLNKLTLILFHVTDAEEGEYLCQVVSVSPAQIWIRKIHVSLLAPPIISEIRGKTAMEGENVTLKCIAEGKPTPSIAWTRLSDNSVVTMPLINISRHDVRNYRCTADNGVQTPATRDVTIDVQYPPERVTLNTNPSISHKVCAGTLATFICAVEASNPEVETFTLFENGSVVSNKRDHGVWFRTLTISGNATYKCTANNSVGVSSSASINFTVEVPASVTNISNSIVVKEGQNVTLVCHGFGIPAPSITWSDAWNVAMEDENIWELPKINRNMTGQYSCTASNACGSDRRNVDIDVQYPVEATGTGETAFVAGGTVKTFTCPVNGNPEPNIEWYSEETGRKISCGKQYKTGESGCYSCVARNSFRTAVNITQCLIVVHERSTTVPSKTVSREIKCTCSDNEITLLVIIGVLGIVIIVLIAVIIWQQRKLRAIGNKRPYTFPEEKDAAFPESEILMRDVNHTHLRPNTSTRQEQIPDELVYMPLQGLSSTGVGSISPVSPAPNVEYAPLDMKTRSWEVQRNDVKVERIIGKGAFGQVAKGRAKNLPMRSGATIVAIKMVKANACESDKRDLKSELKLMKTLKPHPHVIKLLGCVTESEPLLVLIEYVPYGDLLGYLRKSRGLNDTYYEDPDIKPKTNLTSQQLMKFAWQIADGMSYLSLRKVVHRDLAARNALVGERETCKITDFGMARDVHQENFYERKTKGRLPVKWTAYESLLYGQYTTKSDVWSYGVVLYEIFTIGGSPYPRTKGREIANLLQQGYRMPKPEHVDNDLYQIMMNCWKRQPESRPSFSDLTQQLKRLENQHKRLINMHIYDKAMYANLEDLNA